MEIKSYTPTASIIDLLMDAVFAVDANGRIVYASAACERIFAYTPQEMIGRLMFDMIVPEDRERTSQSASKVMSGEPQLHFENRYIRKDGKIAHIMWSARWSEADQVRIGVARDITQRKRAESMQAALHSIAEASYAATDLPTLFGSIHQIISTLLPANNFLVAVCDEANGQLIFPYYVDTQETTSSSSHRFGSLCADVIRHGRPLLLNPDNMSTYLQQQQISMDPLPLCWLGVPLKSHNGTIGVLVLKSYPGDICYDERDQELLQFVSTQVATAVERQQMQARLQYMAQYDQLTTLPNRSLLYDRLKVALLNAKRERGHLSLLYLDLDKFKQVNDTLGHHTGDLLLQEVAKRIKQCLRESDTVARVGGDEFVILLQLIPMAQQANLVAEKIRKALRPAFNIGPHTLIITPSIGIAHYPDHGSDEQQLLQYADKQMYAEKYGEKAIPADIS